MDFDVIVIGAGISGLTAGSLLAKRGLKVGVIVIIEYLKRLSQTSFAH